MSQDRTAEASEAEIAVHWQEEGNVHPPQKFVAQANLTDRTVLERFGLNNFPDCFKEYAERQTRASTRFVTSTVRSSSVSMGSKWRQGASGSGGPRSKKNC